jgi:hypothetical protein
MAAVVAVVPLPENDPRVVDAGTGADRLRSAGVSPIDRLVPFATTV